MTAMPFQAGQIENRSGPGTVAGAGNCTFRFGLTGFVVGAAALDCVAGGDAPGSVGSYQPGIAGFRGSISAIGMGLWICKKACRSLPGVGGTCA